MLRDLVGSQSGARQFDHRADHVLDFHAVLARHFARDFVNDFGLLPQFFTYGNERHHDFQLDLLALAFHLAGGFEDRATLHPGDFRKQQTQTAAAKAEHRIRLAYPINVM